MGDLIGFGVYPGCLSFVLLLCFSFLVLTYSSDNAFAEHLQTQIKIPTLVELAFFWGPNSEQTKIK